LASTAQYWYRRSACTRYDASYALQVFAAHPTRFRLVKPVDPTDPAVVDTIADWAGTKGTVGIRVFLRDNASTDPADPAINRVLATAAQRSLPVNVACTGRLEAANAMPFGATGPRRCIGRAGAPSPRVSGRAGGDATRRCCARDGWRARLPNQPIQSRRRRHLPPLSRAHQSRGRGPENHSDRQAALAFDH
jgi:hypothetical protein